MNQIIEIDDDKIGKPHNGKPITKIEISPNEKCLVTYSEEDNSIFCWNVNNVNEGSDGNVNNVNEGQLYPINTSIEIPDNITINQICVSDDMKLVYIYEFTEKSQINKIKIYDMKNNQKIELDYDLDEYEYCTFSLEGEFILYNRDSVHKKLQKVIIIYSTKTRNNKWRCKRMYRLPIEFELITSKDDNFYLFANNSIYEWNILTKNSIKIFGSDEMEYKDMSEIRKDFKIFSNEKFICTRIKSKIIIYSIELEIPIASLDINNDIQICNYMNYMKYTGLNLPLLLLLLSTNTSKIWNYVMEYCWKERLDQNEQDNIQTKTKSFRILDGYVWKAEVEEKISNINLMDEFHDKIIKNKKVDDKIGKDLNEAYETYEHLNIHLFSLYTSNILKLSRVIESNFEYQNKLESLESLEYNSIRWEISTCNERSIILQVYSLNKDNKDNDDLISSRTENFNAPKDIFLLGIEESLLKYGVGLLEFAIKEQKIELVDDIYKKCISYFKKDLRNNRMFLSIITSTMPYFNEYFPDYITKYSLETAMIIDNPIYNIEYRQHKSQLHSFQYPQIADLTKSILWLRYNTWMGKLAENHGKYFTIAKLLIKLLIILPIFPIYFFTFYILSKFHFINDAYENGTYSIYYDLVSFFDKKLSKNRTTPIITFMIPYIKFMNYPRDYGWFRELILPQHSPFVDSIRSDIFKTLDGEALINFKWNTYGKYYHSIIWIGYAALLVCFDTAAGIPDRYIGADIRNKLLIASSILGFLHLIFEFRQFIYDPAKWIRSYGNIIDTCIYFLPTFTSILWLRTSDYHQIIPYSTFSCLLLNLKLISFFRIFEIYDEYYTIVIRIAKRAIFFFACFIMVILASFAFAFYILLSPKEDYSLDTRTFNDDPNNPWNLTATYQVFVNETSTSPNLFILQQPDENTNMFTNYANSLFATCLLLTGDTSSLSNWPYEENPTLMILMILFAFAMAIYILNVFITLFGEAMQDNEESYLIMKAEYLVKIELFYLLPFQRRWKSWFPEVIHYHAGIKKTRKEIKKMIEHKEWKTKEFPNLKRRLTEELEIEDDTLKGIYIDKATT
ncbi:hypothetical protein GLOIN_2v1772114 [Rhizophagus irregularis DAOM 181602=DAOM 197198]|nr:hypothetical protein GLOIN_2v1772114 [Rhizophagus irregularis DAOM 181602=DAOM 197198]